MFGYEKVKFGGSHSVFQSMGEATESYSVFMKVDIYCCAVLPVVCEHC